MTNPTSNYGFVLPTASDLVTDLPADFDVALQGVDTRLKALNPETTLGDLSYGSATANTNTRLPIGTTGQVLAVSGGVPTWTTTADVTPLTTKGDLFTYTTQDARLGVGTNGQVLKANSATATGLEWGAASAGLVWSLVSTTAMSGSSTITLSGLNHKALRLVMFGASSATANIFAQVRINNDSANYRESYWSLNAESTWAQTNYGGSGGSSSSILIGTTGASTATTITAWVDISSADQTTGFKPYNAGAGSSASGASRISYNTGGIYIGSSAVTSLVVLAGSNFNAGTIQLYGAN